MSNLTAKARFTKERFKEQQVNFRIEAIVSDGMWLSQPKWRKQAHVTEDELENWIQRNLPKGVIVQSLTGERSYRMPYDQIIRWYQKQGFVIGEQIFDNIFPVRIWDDKTEVEGFLEAPLREIGMVTFHADGFIADRIKEALRGIGRIRQVFPGEYKVYCLSALATRKVIEPILVEAYGEKERKMYSRNMSYRREMRDFSHEFGYRLVEFYKNFSRSLVKGAQETIDIFIEDREDQESQLIMWVIAAIEKFDESASIPFSGYLSSVLNRWVYDLPDEALGKELSSFQRERSRATKLLRAKKGGEHNREFSNEEIASTMGMERAKFFAMESQNKIWSSIRSRSPLTWDESGEEKGQDVDAPGESTVVAAPGTSGQLSVETDIKLASKMSYSLVAAALETQDYDSAFSLISQINSDQMDLTKIDNLGAEFVIAFGENMGLQE